MRHLNKISKLGRDSEARKALLRSLAVSLVTHKQLITTTTKAKALSRFIEPLITRSKDGCTANRRLVFARIDDKEATKILFEEVGPKVGDRPGGYTRILKTGYRHGDGSEESVIELVDFSLAGAASAKTSKKKRTRRGGAGKKGAETTEKTGSEPEQDAE